MEVNLIYEGIKFLVLGMTTVFLFLLLMIYVLKLQTKIINKYFNKESSKKLDIATNIDQIKEDENAQIVAVITAAITDFRKN